MLIVWIITERVSKIKIPLITINAGIVSVINATTARVAQSESEPTSHIKIAAGWILNQRNAISAHAIIKQSAERI